MPEPIVAADAQPAVSSPAVDLSPAAAPSEGVDLDTLSQTELRTWRMDGTLPSTSPVTTPPADSSPAPAVQDQPASTDAPVAAASEPAWTPAALKAETKKRFDELLTHNTRERERADRAERALADSQRRPQSPVDARPAASSAAPAGLIKPDADAFAYGTADPAYLEALTDYKVAVSVETQRTAWDEGQRHARARDEATRVMAGFEERRTAATAKHPDFDAIAMLAPTEIPQGSALDLFILEDPSGAEVLYHLQQPANTAECRRISRLGPLDQLKEAVRLGDRLTATAPATRSTQAPPPPPVLSTRATPADAVERAIAADDTAAYNAAMNARELAAKKR